jgi:hypothetical protein
VAWAVALRAALVAAWVTAWVTAWVVAAVATRTAVHLDVQLIQPSEHVVGGLLAEKARGVLLILPLLLHRPSFVADVAGGLPAPTQWPCAVFSAVCLFPFSYALFWSLWLSVVGTKGWIPSTNEIANPIQGNLYGIHTALFTHVQSSPRIGNS